MASYEVEVWGKADVSTSIVVEANSEEEARDKALEDTFQNGDLPWKWEGLTEDIAVTEISQLEVYGE